MLLIFGTIWIATLTRSFAPPEYSAVYVAAFESASNAVPGPSMIPLLALGVPGSTIAAILLGVLLIHGISVGLRIFIDPRELVYALFAADLVSIAVFFLLGFDGDNTIGRIIAKVPPRIHLSLYLRVVLRVGICRAGQCL